MFSARSFFTFLSGVVVMLFVAFPSFQDAWSTITYRWQEEIIQTDLPDEQVSVDTYTQKLFELDAVLDRGYYEGERINKQLMYENALKGYIDALGDPHTEYLTRDEQAVFNESMQGTQNFEGIGAVVTKKKDGIMISEVLKGSPAFTAGLQPLDIILAIESESTQNMSLGDAVGKIRGPKDTIVRLSIFRQRDGEEAEIFDLDVTRGTIDVPSVTLEELVSSGANYLHIQIGIFGEDTIVKLREAIMQVTTSYDGVILDLRGNGGGYLPTAVQLASFFLPRNELVTTARYTLLPDEIFRSAGYAHFVDIPTVVLIDGMSASASEIVAGSLKQRGGAILVGTKTFGKGSIQTLKQFGDGSLLKYTVGRRYLPNDTTIDMVGLEPDVEIAFDRDLFTLSGVDQQLEKALDVFQDPFYREGRDEPCCGNIAE